MTTDQPKSGSRLAKHMQIIGVENSELKKHDLEFERAGIASMNPPALNLDRIQQLRVPAKSASRKHSSSWISAIAIGLAALVAVFVFVPKEDSGFRVKGAGQIRIFAEFDGKVAEWDRLTELNSGTRLRVEFKALSDMNGVVGVVDRNFNDLFSAETIWNSNVPLKTGDVKLSAGSIELTGENEGEILITATCPQSKFPKDLPAFREFWVDVKSAFLKKANIKLDVAGCNVESIALR